ncbi:MAG: hypothetical protein ACKPKO_08955, partial [Candidatus Fonsibacter sp.]
MPEKGAFPNLAKTSALIMLLTCPAASSSHAVPFTRTRPYLTVWLSSGWTSEGRNGEFVPTKVSTAESAVPKQYPLNMLMRHRKDVLDVHNPFMLCNAALSVCTQLDFPCATQVVRQGPR